jgi:hypothetical protein
MPDLPEEFAIEPVVGLRCWGLTRDDRRRLRLCSPTYHGDLIVWPTGKALTAECARSAGEHHAAPDADCRCGIYATMDGFPYYGWDGPTAAVFGEVVMWGTIIAHQHGYRAEFAYPRTLNLAFSDARFRLELQTEYGVPVNLKNPFKEAM